jgi:hypothetical protein
VAGAEQNKSLFSVNIVMAAGAVTYGTKFMNSYLTVNTLRFHYEDQPHFVVETITNKQMRVGKYRFF